MDSVTVTWLTILLLTTAVIALEWDYSSGRTGPSNWSQIASPLCAGKRQSPVAIWLNELELRLVPEEFPYIHFGNLSSPINGAKIENNGHSVQVTLPSDVNVTISGGPLKHEYTLRQLHFHWASVDNLGSEHTIGDTHYPAEGHFVHTYEATIDNSTKSSVYIAVVGVFFKLVPGSYVHSTPLAELSKYITSLEYKGDARELGFTLQIENFYPERHNSYITYAGSLTTPPCTENVQWLLFTDPVPITATELNSFRNLHASRRNEANKWLQQNFRPVQMLYGRDIYYVQEKSRADASVLPHRQVSF